MDKQTMTGIIMTAKREKGLSWQTIANEVSMSATWVCSVCLGMNSAPEAVARDLGRILELDESTVVALQTFPHKAWANAIPQDPLIYRLYEIVGVYGDTLKEIIHEQFGDGIMSAIDFSMDVQKQEDPKGDRVVVTLNGKFLPYKSW